MLDFSERKDLEGLSEKFQDKMHCKKDPSSWKGKGSFSECGGWGQWSFNYHPKKSVPCALEQLSSIQKMYENVRFEGWRFIAEVHWSNFKASEVQGLSLVWATLGLASPHRSPPWTTSFGGSVSIFFSRPFLAVLEVSWTCWGCRNWVTHQLPAGAVDHAVFSTTFFQPFNLLTFRAQPQHPKISASTHVLHGMNAKKSWKRSLRIRLCRHGMTWWSNSWYLWGLGIGPEINGSKMV